MALTKCKECKKEVSTSASLLEATRAAYSLSESYKVILRQLFSAIACFLQQHRNISCYTGYGLAINFGIGAELHA